MTADRAVDVAAKALAEPWEYADGSDDPPLDVFRARAVVVAFRRAGLLLPEPAERRRGGGRARDGSVIRCPDEGCVRTHRHPVYRLVGPWTRAEPETGGGE